MNIYASNKAGFFTNTLRKYPAVNEGQERSIQLAFQDDRPILGVMHEYQWIHLADITDLKKSAKQRGI